VTVLRTVVAPLVAAYALFAWLAWCAWRHPRTPSTVSAADVSTRRLVRHVLVTAAGGFGAFLAIVLVFHVWLAGQRAAFRDAITGGGFLAVSAAVLFLAISAVERRLRR
jgi:uncharacterized membrane protein